MKLGAGCPVVNTIGLRSRGHWFDSTHVAIHHSCRNKLINRRQGKVKLKNKICLQFVKKLLPNEFALFDQSKSLLNHPKERKGEREKEREKDKL